MPAMAQKSVAAQPKSAAVPSAEPAGQESSAEPPLSVLPSPDEIVLAAVLRNSSAQRGGAGSEKKAGHVYVEPMALITAAGEWRHLSCEVDRTEDCAEFEEGYLRKPHTYTVVSADGAGDMVFAEPTRLDEECFGFGGEARITGAPIVRAAIAASDAAGFVRSAPVQAPGALAERKIRKAMATLSLQDLSAAARLRLFSFSLEGQPLIVAQRSYTEMDRRHGRKHSHLIFAVGRMEKGGFRILFWKKNVVDEEERVLGVIRLKSGREFLLTTVRDPETSFYRVYSLKGGSVELVFEGGGGGC
jgi:hypothetical protein